MGYYTIRLDPNSSKICTLIFPWGKYSYLRLPMGIAGSPDIFQAKMSALMVALEFVQAYFDDLLCISKGNLVDHLDKLNMVLTRLRKAGLHIKTGKLFFCAIERESLVYTLIFSWGKYANLWLPMGIAGSPDIFQAKCLH